MQTEVRLKDRYEVLDIVGSAGGTRVARAFDHQHRRVVALKMTSATSNQERDEFLREAARLLDLPAHEALPLVREDFFCADDYVMVMDWVEGIDLARLLRETGSPGLPLSSVLAYLAQAAEALTFLHTQDPSIIHGDVKPSNLILTRGGRVKLVFGLFSTVGRAHQAAAAIEFQAPEIAAGGAVSRRSDVYSLAATACALLTGAAPASGLVSWEHLDAAQAARLQPVLESALSSDPQRRPGTPGEVVELLRSGWASTLPAGVMTFCMSDIEGSSRLWEERPAAMAEALVRHDELIARVMESHGGRFLKSMGEGDSTVSVFESAAQAVRAAIAAGRSLKQERWPEGAALRVRFGLHTGEAQRRDGDYFGPTLNLAARVRAEASGGEILLTEKTATLAKNDLPAGHTTVDLGPHRFAGIEQPVTVRAVTGPGFATAHGGCPYRGLLAFEASDRHLFFGREEVVGDVLARIARGRLLAVVGASGSGKSSLLRAGVIAAVQAGELTSAHSTRLITPGANPPLDLESDQSELLVVDQFEELYTQSTDGETRSRFIDALLHRKGPVVVGVRADFYGEVSGHGELADAVASNQVLLGPMSEPELRRAVCAPARLMGFRLEAGLVDLILRDVAGEPGALPLMSHALRETWERRQGRTLTAAAYRESGGVSSALAQTADAVARRTPKEEQDLLRSVFLRLTAIGDDMEETRRRVHIEELVPEGVSSEAVRTLLERLADARLVTLGRDTAELAHEVLIRRWPMLRRWLEEDREGIRLHRRLGDAARLWEAAGRESSDLYRGARLDAAVEWAHRNRTRLNQTERDFLNAGLEEFARSQRTQLQINRRLRRALVASGGLLLLALGLLVFALISRHSAVKTGSIARSRAIANEAESQVAHDPQRALLLARAALAAAPTPEAELATSEALDANTVRAQLPSFGTQGCATANYMYLLEHGHVAVDNTCDGYVVFGDLVHRRLLKRVRVGATSTDMTLSPDGRTLTVATGRDLVALDAGSGRVRHILTAPFPISYTGNAPVGNLLAITDGASVAVVEPTHKQARVVAHGDTGVNGVIDMLWAAPGQLLVETGGHSAGHGDLRPGLTLLNVRNGVRRAVPLPMAAGHVAALGFMNVAPDRKTWFITGADLNPSNSTAAATTWGVDARTHRVLWVAHGPVGATADSVNASPDGRLLGVGYTQGAIDVLDASTGHLIVRHVSSASIAAGWMAFPPGDGALVTVSLDGVFRIWAAQGTERLRVQVPPAPAVDFTPDGKRIELLGQNSEVLDRLTGVARRRLPGFPARSIFNNCNAACFSSSPQLRWLTYLEPASRSPRIIELDGRTARRVAAVSLPRLDAQGVAPDGRVVAAYVDAGQLRARLISPRSGRVRELEPGPSSAGCAATTPSFSSDSRLMAIVDGCVHVVIWDLRNGRVVRSAVLPDRANASSAAGGGNAATGAHLSPDGSYVLVAVEGGGLVRIGLTTARFLERPGTQTVARALAISPNGRFYAIGREDGTVDEYDARSFALVRHHALDNPIQTLVFSPNSRDLAVEDANNVLRTWDTCAICESRSALARLAAQESIRALTSSERATFGLS